MRVLKMVFDNGYPEGHIEDAVIIPDNYREEQIKTWVEEEFCEFCENYAYLANGFPWKNLSDGKYRDENEMFDDEQFYYNNCGYEMRYITLNELKEWCDETGRDFGYFENQAIYWLERRL